MAPGLRLGWMICPPGIVGDVVAEKEWADRGSAGLDQLALTSLIRSGRYDRHLRRMRPKYARRRAALVGAMAKHVPTAEVCGLDAGLHAVVKLDPALDEREIITAARERSVGLYGLSDWRHNGATSPPQLVLGFGTSRRVQSNRASPRSQTC